MRVDQPSRWTNYYLARLVARGMRCSTAANSSCSSQDTRCYLLSARMVYTGRSADGENCGRRAEIVAKRHKYAPTWRRSHEVPTTAAPDDTGG
jgi:hypothetical protein